MNKQLQKIINELKAEGKDYANFKILFSKFNDKMSAFRLEK